MVGRRSRAAQRGFVVEQIRRGQGPIEARHGVPGRALAGHVLSYRGYRNERGGLARLRLVPSLRLNLDFSVGVRPWLADSGTVPAGRCTACAPILRCWCVPRVKACSWS